MHGSAADGEKTRKKREAIESKGKQEVAALPVRRRSDPVIEERRDATGRLRTKTRLPQAYHNLSWLDLSDEVTTMTDMELQVTTMTNIGLEVMTMTDTELEVKTMTDTELATNQIGDDAKEGNRRDARRGKRLAGEAGASCDVTAINAIRDSLVDDDAEFIATSSSPIATSSTAIATSSATSTCSRTVDISFHQGQDHMNARLGKIVDRGEEKETRLSRRTILINWM